MLYHVLSRPLQQGAQLLCHSPEKGVHRPYLFEYVEMKKIILVIIYSFAVCMTFPAIADAAWRVVLKSGGEFITSHYWSDDGEILLYAHGSVVGVSRDAILTIEKVASEEIRKPEAGNDEQVATATPDGEEAIEEDDKPESTVDIAPYKERKSQLEAELKAVLQRVREADRNKDKKAAEKAKEEAKEISARMYELTDELMKENDGKMPDEWWDED